MHRRLCPWPFAESGGGICRNAMKKAGGTWPPTCGFNGGWEGNRTPDTGIFRMPDGWAVDSCSCGYAYYGRFQTPHRAPSAPCSRNPGHDGASSRIQRQHGRGIALRAAPLDVLGQLAAPTELAHGGTPQPLGTLAEGLPVAERVGGLGEGHVEHAVCRVPDLPRVPAPGVECGHRPVGAANAWHGTIKQPHHDVHTGMAPKTTRPLPAETGRGRKGYLWPLAFLGFGHGVNMPSTCVESSGLMSCHIGSSMKSRPFLRAYFAAGTKSLSPVMTTT